MRGLNGQYNEKAVLAGAVSGLQLVQKYYVQLVHLYHAGAVKRTSSARLAKLVRAKRARNSRLKG